MKTLGSFAKNADIQKMQDPGLFARYGVQPPRGVLLWGPPGTGKTRLAAAMAAAAGAAFFVINGPDIVSAFYGHSEQGLRVSRVSPWTPAQCACESQRHAVSIMSSSFSEMSRHRPFTDSLTSSFCSLSVGCRRDGHLDSGAVCGAGRFCRRPGCSPVDRLH